MERGESASTIKVFVRVRPLVMSEQHTDKVTEVLHDVLASPPRTGPLGLFTTATTTLRSNLTTPSTRTKTRATSTATSITLFLASLMATTWQYSHTDRLAQEKPTLCSAKAKVLKKETRWTFPAPPAASFLVQLSKSSTELAPIRSPMFSAPSSRSTTKRSMTSYRYISYQTEHRKTETPQCAWIETRGYICSGTDLVRSYQGRWLLGVTGSGNQEQGYQADLHECKKFEITLYIPGAALNPGSKGRLLEGQTQLVRSGRILEDQQKGSNGWVTAEVAEKYQPLTDHPRKGHLRTIKWR